VRHWSMAEAHSFATVGPLLKPFEIALVLSDKLITRLVAIVSAFHRERPRVVERTFSLSVGIDFRR